MAADEPRDPGHQRLASAVASISRRSPPRDPLPASASGYLAARARTARPGRLGRRGRAARRSPVGVLDAWKSRGPAPVGVDLRALRRLGSPRSVRGGWHGARRRQDAEGLDVGPVARKSPRAAFDGSADGVGASGTGRKRPSRPRSSRARSSDGPSASTDCVLGPMVWDRTTDHQHAGPRYSATFSRISRQPSLRRADLDDEVGDLGPITRRQRPPGERA